jgi:NAD(P) transhydrogenase subunit alpha
MFTIFVPKESQTGESRVAATPDSVRRLIKLGVAVQVESGAGAGSLVSDEAFRESGATIVTDAAAAYRSADMVVRLNPPSPEEAARMREKVTLVSFVYPGTNTALFDTLRERKATVLAMESVPRITRAQKMDALSSQANLSGYKAVLQAADALPRIFPMLMTAAGTIQPSRVVVLGAGVAGLQAIATAKRLGAIVEVSDVRPAVKEQVESLGAKYIEVPTDESMEGSGGYAKEQSEEFLRRQREIVRKKIVEADVVISTAAIPGKPAPRLIPADMVADMRPGSVIVDLAVETGGNCELSEPGKTVVKHGVTIIGFERVPSLVPVNASEVYARNVVNLLADLVKDGQLQLDTSDEVVDATMILHEGVPRGAAAAGTGGKPA